MDELDPLFGTLAGYFAALAEPSRLRIMHAICEKERSVGAIAAATGISQPNVSRHLRLMRLHGLVRHRRAGNLVYYRVADRGIPAVCRSVCARIAAGMEQHRPLQRRLLALIPGPKRRGRGGT